jgi:WhiB family redox-sensing transcriptional regulator
MSPISAVVVQKKAFFPEPGSSPRPAKAVCHACPVRAECLEYALANDELYGVWGGLSPQARGELRRARAAAERGAA